MNCLKVFLVITIFASLVCKDKQVEVGQVKTPSFLYETSQCLSPVLSRYVSTSFDSVFNYSFSNKLSMDFSAIGNCCPDSNRFVVNHEIRTDTIFIIVVDTAQNLCRCNCLYMVHAEVDGLPVNRYVVRCCLNSGENSIDPLHLATVVRN